MRISFNIGQGFVPLAHVLLSYVFNSLDVLLCENAGLRCAGDRGVWSDDVLLREAPSIVAGSAVPHGLLEDATVFRGHRHFFPLWQVSHRTLLHTTVPSSPLPYPPLECNRCLDMQRLVLSTTMPRSWAEVR